MAACIHVGYLFQILQQIGKLGEDGSLEHLLGCILDVACPGIGTSWLLHYFDGGHVGFGIKSGWLHEFSPEPLSSNWPPIRHKLKHQADSVLFPAYVY